MGGGGVKPPERLRKKHFFLSVKKYALNLIYHLALGGGGTLTLVVF